MSGAPTQKDMDAPAPVPDFLCAGSSFARYQIVRCIGVGGMGAVFEATHVLLRKRVALKAMHSSLGRSEASRARFLREAETVARIRHPHVVDISDVGIERGVPFLVMEFLEGEDLSNVLEREPRLAVERAVDLALPVVAALCTVHRLGIVHRDIKPENVFLALDGLGDVVPKLLDFGVSKHVEASGADAPARHSVAGTPFYMAPEQAHGSGVLDARADQYAVGVLLYQCLAGARPFQSESLLELIHLIDSGEYTPLSAHRQDLPEGLEAVIARAMARAPERRYPDTESFGLALSEFASEGVRRACARDFTVERRSSLPLRPPPAGPGAEAASFGAGSEASPPSQAARSAPTLPSESLPALEPASVPTRAFPRRSVSGVHARESAAGFPGAVIETSAARTPGSRARRAFVLAALVTLLCLVGVLAALLGRRPPVPVAPPTHGEPRAEPIAPAPAAPAAGSAAPLSQPQVAPRPAPEPSRPRVKPRREAAPSAAPPRPDIQLSR